MRPETIGPIPAGWKRVAFTRGSLNKFYCHNDEVWWKGPDGTEYCGTCHPTPWLGYVEKEMPPAMFDEPVPARWRKWLPEIVLIVWVVLFVLAVRM